MIFLVKSKKTILIRWRE